MLGYQLGMLLWLVIARPRLPGPDSGGKRLPHRLAAGLLAGCLTAGPLVLLLWPWAARPSGAELAAWLSSLGVTRQTWPFFAVYLCLTTPWLEERFWRSWLGRGARPAFETSAWFAGYHLLVLMPVLRPAWLALVFVSLASAGWAWQRLLGFRGGFGWAVLTHSIADASVLLAAASLLGR
jgi:hypothetical protein